MKQTFAQIGCKLCKQWAWQIFCEKLVSRFPLILQLLGLRTEKDRNVVFEKNTVGRNTVGVEPIRQTLAVDES